MVRCLLVAGIIFSGEAVYYRCGLHVSKRWLNISNHLQRLANNFLFSLSPMALLATQCSSKSFSGSLSYPEQLRPKSVKKIRFPLMIAVALIGAFTLYSEQKH